MIITISGKPGCGSTTTGKLLAKKLNLEFFSAGDYFKSHAEGKSTERALKFWKTKKANTKEFHESLEDIYITKAKEANP